MEDGGSKHGKLYHGIMPFYTVESVLAITFFPPVQAEYFLCFQYVIPNHTIQTTSTPPPPPPRTSNSTTARIPVPAFDVGPIAQPQVYFSPLKKRAPMEYHIPLRTYISVPRRIVRVHNMRAVTFGLGRLA